MSDDNLYADSPEELSAEETVETAESASDETTDEANGEVAVPKGKEKALRDTEAALAERKAEFTRVTQELAQMKGALNTLMQLQATQRQQQEVEKDWMEDLDDEKVISDPKAAMKFVRDQLRKEIAGVLESRDAFLLSKVGNTNIDPDLKAKVDELKSDPELADLPDSKLVAMAKKMSLPKKAVMKPVGSVASSQRGSSVPSKKAGASDDVKAILMALGLDKAGKRDDTLE